MPSPFLFLHFGHRCFPPYFFSVEGLLVISVLNIETEGDGYCSSSDWVDVYAACIYTPGANQKKRKLRPIESIALLERDVFCVGDSFLGVLLLLLRVSACCPHNQS